MSSSQSNINTLMRKIEEECKNLIALCEGFRESNINPYGNRPIMHYNVRILKLQPEKVVINGVIKDRASLSARERQAVKAQEEINTARAQLRLQNDMK